MSARPPGIADLVHYIPVDLESPDPVCRAAIVVALIPMCDLEGHLGCADLHVMHRNGCGPVLHVPFDNGQGTRMRRWHWPERLP